MSILTTLVTRSILPTADGCARTAQAWLCFLDEERYENEVIREPIPTDCTRYDAVGARTATTLTFAPVQEATA